MIVDLRPLKVFTDFFVICHGTSSRHVVSISEAVEQALEREMGVRPGHVEGRRVGEWVLLDYIDLVVHVFTADRRAFYGLEKLWGDAPRIALPETGGDSGPTARRARPARRAKARSG